VTHPSDVAAVAERLRGQGIDVIRVSYPDMIGIDRGRDVLLDELASVTEHGLAFCRAVYHTSPMGDVVPVQGGLDAGLPDITVRPDLATLTPLPWEPNAAWCLGDASTTDGSPAPESPRTVVRRVADQLSGLGYQLSCGPEL
jgi:glutamine synthetase